TRKAGGVLTQLRAAAARFDADHLDLFVSDEVIKQTDGIASSANARNEYVGQPSFFLQNLSSHLTTDHGLKITDHERIRMRPKNRAKHVVSRTDVCYPIAHGFVDGIFQRLASSGYRYHART